MYVPHRTGRYYCVEVIQKGHSGKHLWEGWATHVMDAFTQARNDYNSTLLWTLLECRVVMLDCPPE